MSVETESVFYCLADSQNEEENVLNTDIERENYTLQI